MEKERFLAGGRVEVGVWKGGRQLHFEAGHGNGEENENNQERKKKKERKGKEEIESKNR